MNGIQDCLKLESVQSVNPLIGIEKKCPKCGKTKRLFDFSKDKRKKNGRRCHCKDCSNKYAKQYRLENPDYAKQYRINHKDYIKQYRINNPEKIRVILRRNSTRIRSTLNGKLNSNISCGICRSLNSNSKNGHHWEVLTDFTVNQLKSHLEKQFTEGMTWGNYGTWHIDHIIPISAFNFNRPEDIDFKRCWALKNLQPLWGFDNCSKYNKIVRPFQPSLAF